MRELADILAGLQARGYVPAYVESGHLRWHDGTAALGHVELLDSIAADCGTDPGDDVTIYLVRTAGGTLAYLMLPDSAHTDPDKSRFIDSLVARRGHLQDSPAG